MTKYEDIAPKVLSRTELLTNLIHDASQVISTASRLLEIENGIKTDDKVKANSEYNVNRTLAKRVSALEDSLRALELMPDQLGAKDQRVFRSAQIVKVDRLVKLLKWHPDAKTLLAEAIDASGIQDQGGNVWTDSIEKNPYHAANAEDFDDE